MVLNYNDLYNLYRQNQFECNPKNINGASVDITLNNKILVENVNNKNKTVVSLAEKEIPEFNEIEINSGFLLKPGQFILASTQEKFALPNNICAEYKLKSSLARAGLEHLNAGWIDQTYHGTLTLELKNMLERHVLFIKPGMKIGQIVFYKTEPVKDEHSYINVGQYNHHDKPVIKGVR